MRVARFREAAKPAWEAEQQLAFPKDCLGSIASTLKGKEWGTISWWHGDHTLRYLVFRYLIMGPSWDIRR